MRETRSFAMNPGMSGKEIFKKIFFENIHREGAAEMMKWLDESDFFTAPASTKYHLCREGGLVDHSIHVYDRLQFLYDVEKAVNDSFPDYSEETIAITALLHDVCKANFYATDYRNRKNENGQWEKVQVYTVNDQLPFGHGEKSVYIVSKFLKLSDEEAMAIRWHMGFSDTDYKGGGYNVGKAFEMFKLCPLIHFADSEATYFDETEG